MSPDLAATSLLAGLVTMQGLLALRVAWRLLRTAGGRRVAVCVEPCADRLAVVVPVLDEAQRLPGCLEALLRQPAEAAEILVVDGGSRDGTREIVRRYAARDSRVRLVDASPVPGDWTGKAWNLHVGLHATSPACTAVLCLDADVRVAPALTRSLLRHLAETGVAAFSIATRQRLATRAEGVLHPSLLATLVYRFGIPGGATADPAAVQANGQCFVARRGTLLSSEATRAAQASLCEDVTIARHLAACGHRVGFYEAGDLVDAAMYAGWRDAWRNWPRSLPMRDQYSDWRGALGLAEIALVQALPLPALAVALAAGAPGWALAPLAGLGAMRLGVLVGMARAYAARPWTYWLSPLADLAVAAAIAHSAVRARHRWRGRVYERIAPGRFRLATE
jgi:dolichol-phosphate mannosyltransferase